MELEDILIGSEKEAKQITIFHGRKLALFCVVLLPELCNCEHCETSSTHKVSILTTTKILALKIITAFVSFYNGAFRDGCSSFSRPASLQEDPLKHHHFSGSFRIHILPERPERTAAVSSSRSVLERLSFFETVSLSCEYIMHVPADP